MKDKIQKLHDFMEKFHNEKMTDCSAVTNKLKEAYEALKEGGTQEEIEELSDVIIPELEQMETVCQFREDCDTDMELQP